MGILSRLKGAFRRKKKEEPLPEIEKPKVELGLEPVTMENVRAKMELVVTQMDSLRTQYEAMNERIKNIERLVTEIRGFCK